MDILNMIFDLLPFLMLGFIPIGGGWGRDESQSKPEYLFGKSDSDIMRALRQGIWGQLEPSLGRLLPSEFGLSQQSQEALGSGAMGGIAQAQQGAEQRLAGRLASRGLTGSGAELGAYAALEGEYGGLRQRAQTDLAAMQEEAIRKDREQYTNTIRDLLAQSGSPSQKSSGENYNIGFGG